MFLNFLLLRVYIFLEQDQQSGYLWSWLCCDDPGAEAHWEIIEKNVSDGLAVAVILGIKALTATAATAEMVLRKEIRTAEFIRDWYKHSTKVWTEQNKIDNVWMEASPQPLATIQGLEYLDGSHTPVPGIHVSKESGISPSPGSCFSPDFAPKKSHQMMTPLAGYLNCPSQTKHMVFWDSFSVSSLGDWKTIQEHLYPLNLNFF